MPETFLSEFLSHQKYVISTHLKPDADAVGSQLALGRFLSKLNKEVVLINSDTPPANLEWLPGIAAIEIFDGGLAQRENIDQADAYVVVDANEYARLGPVGQTISNSPGAKYLVDHHTNPAKGFDATWVDVMASSTGELLFDLISSHDAEIIDYEIAVNLYVAIMTDTGSFRYSNVTAQLHRKIAELIDKGELTVASIHDKVYTRTMAGLKLLGQTLSQMKIVCDGRVGYLVLTQQTLRNLGADRDDTEGLVNYPLSIDGVDMAVFFYETDRGTKVSFRSLGELRVDKLARSFGGGGHRNASGAFLKGPLSTNIDRVLRVLPKHLNLTADSEKTAATH